MYYYIQITILIICLVIYIYINVCVFRYSYTLYSYYYMYLYIQNIVVIIEIIFYIKNYNYIVIIITQQLNLYIWLICGYGCNMFFFEFSQDDLKCFLFQFEYPSVGQFLRSALNGFTLVTFSAQSRLLLHTYQCFDIKLLGSQLKIKTVQQSQKL